MSYWSEQLWSVLINNSRTVGPRKVSMSVFDFSFQIISFKIVSLLLLKKKKSVHNFGLGHLPGMNNTQQQQIGSAQQSKNAVCVL